MIIDFSFIDPDSPRWSEALGATRHDFYHLPSYARLAGRLEGGEAMAFVAEEGGRRLLVPLIVRPIPAGVAGGGGLLDATCPYGYPGLLFDPGAEGEGRVRFLDRAIEILLRQLRERNIISLFLRLHPILAHPLEPLARAGHLCQHGETISIDLTISEEDNRKQICSMHRRAIQRAERMGTCARIDREWREIEAFVGLYYQTMWRAGADDAYHFPRDYFSDLRRALDGRLHLCVTELEGRIISAGLFAETSGIVQYHLSGSDEEFLAHSPLKAMLDFVRRWAKGRGDRIFHLGGGVGGKEDSLFAFKAGFSRARHPFYTWRAVTDEPAYRALIGRWELCSGMRADGIDGFFTAYRRPAARIPG
ncbi:MAG TPA: GNAT family N-acetyltransferase [Isosphaeraceae bacterium]|nr:GNAT family N-acetyltransferase [Isosphaeraceae bacterium]